MALDATTNFGKVSVAQGYNASATSINLGALEGLRLPDPSVNGQYNLTWWNVSDYPDPSDDPNREIVRVTAKVGDILTVTRAQETTTATVKNVAGKTYKMVLSLTSKMVVDIQTELDGKAALVHTHAASDIVSGVIATARLGTGTQDSTTFLRGDGTWAVPITGSGTIGGSSGADDNRLIRADGTSGDSIQASAVTLDDSGNLTGVVSIASLTTLSMANGGAINFNSGDVTLTHTAADTLTLAGGTLVANSIQLTTGSALRTGQSAGNTLLLQARDVDGATFVTFLTLTANNTPTADLNTAVTIGGAAIYRAGGTDVSLADGGTGASLVAPSADRIYFYDVSGGNTTFLEVGSGLEIVGTTLQINSSGGTGNQVVMQDDFAAYTQGQIITDSTTYSFASFPNAGDSGPTNPSTKWEADTGRLLCDTDGNGQKWGYSGRPIDWPDKFFFRANTQASVADAIVSFDYKSAAFGLDGYAVEGGDATDIWLRYQTQYHLYVLQFDRTNNGITCKRKVPTNDNGQWTGPAGLISNKGIYYQLFTNSNQPIFGAGQQFISWAGVQSLITAESAKPNFPNLAHDGTSSGGTTYTFEARITTYDGGGAFDYVQIQLFRGGVLVASFVDDNLGTAANGQSFQSHWNAGFFNNVTGFNSAWGLPIYTAGKSGLRADNIKVWIDNFVMVDAAASGGSGVDVFGPASATDNALARFDATTGGLIQNSTVILDDSGNISGIASLQLNSGGELRTGTSSGNTLLIRGRDVDGAVWTTFLTVTAGNTPTADLGTTVTIGGLQIVTPSSTTTFTNKSIDANGTGNAITNLEVADFTAASIVTEAEGLASSDNDTSIPTTAAVKDYVDTAVSGGGGGTIGGATGATDNAVIRADGAGGTTIQSSTVTINDAGGIASTIAGAGNTVALTLVQNDTTNNPRLASFTNAGTAATLFIDANGNTSVSTSVGGALLIENTGNAGSALVIYSNHAAPTTGANLLSLRADNTAFNATVFAISNDGTGISLLINATGGAGKGIQVDGAGTGTNHTVAIGYQGTSATATALTATSSNPNFTTVGITGVQTDTGTLKVTHTGTGGDANAAAISLDLAGAGTEAQGIFITASGGGTTGPLLNIRNQGGAQRLMLTADGKLGITIASPTAMLHLPAQTATANTAPVKFNGSVTLLTTPEDGVLEYDGTELWFTVGSTRYGLTTGGGAGLGGNLGTVDNVLLRADGTGAATAQGSTVSLNDNGGLSTTIANNGNTAALTIVQNDVTNNPRGISITNAGTGNALYVKPNGNTGLLAASSGAIMLDNTANTDIGLNVYTNNAAPAFAPVFIKVDNAAANVPAMEINHDGTGGFAVAILIRAPSPQIEFYESDQAGGAGKFEIQGQGDIFFVNGRDNGDTTFENAVWFLRPDTVAGMNGHVGIGTNPFAIEKLTIGDTTGGAARMALKFATTPTADVGYGKIWYGSDLKLHFMNGSGTEEILSRNPAGADIVVGAFGDFTTIQAALDAVPSGGATIYVTDGTYSISSGLLIKQSRTRLIFSQGATVELDGAVVTTAIKPNTTALSQIFIWGGKLLQTNATEQGVALDFSDCPNTYVQYMRLEGFGTGIQIIDTTSTSFYCGFHDIQMFDVVNGISLGGTQPNFNNFTNIRIRPVAGGGGTGINLVDTRGCNFMYCNVEPSTAAGITGISIDATSRDNSFEGMWIENCATNILIASGANNNSFFGGTTTAASVANINDAGTLTYFHGVNVGGTKINKVDQFTSAAGLETLKLVSVASAVNEISITNAVTTAGPIISATGGDTDIAINLTPKGVGRVKINAGIHRKYNAISANTTLDGSYDIVDCTANTFTVTLPTAASLAGISFTIKNSGAGVVTVDGDGAETVEDLATWDLNAGDSIVVVSDGTNWVIV